MLPWMIRHFHLKKTRIFNFNIFFNMFLIEKKGWKYNKEDSFLSKKHKGVRYFVLRTVSLQLTQKTLRNENTCKLHAIFFTPSAVSGVSMSPGGIPTTCILFKNDGSSWSHIFWLQVLTFAYYMIEIENLIHNVSFQNNWFIRVK